MPERRELSFCLVKSFVNIVYVVLVAQKRYFNLEYCLILLEDNLYKRIKL